MEFKYGYLFNKKRIILIVILAVAFIATGIYLVFLPKKEEAPPIPIAEVEIINRVNEVLIKSEMTYTNISLSPAFTVDGEIPSEASIYAYSPDEITDEFVSKLASFLKLPNVIRSSQSPDEEILKVFQDNKELYVYKYLGTIIYTNAPVEDAGFDISLDPKVLDTEYSSIAEKFLSDAGFNMTSYILSNKKYLTYPSIEPTEVARPEEAGVVELAYTAAVGGFRLIDRTGNLNPNTITIWVDKNFETRRLNAQISGTKVSPTTTVSIKTEKQLTDEITAGQAKLISTPINLSSEIADVFVKKGYLAYYAMDNKLVPIFVLESDVRDADGKTTDGYLYLEAVRR